MAWHVIKMDNICSRCSKKEETNWMPYKGKVYELCAKCEEGLLKIWEEEEKKDKPKKPAKEPAPETFTCSYSGTHQAGGTSAKDGKTCASDRCRGKFIYCADHVKTVPGNGGGGGGGGSYTLCLTCHKQQFPTPKKTDYGGGAGAGPRVVAPQAKTL